MLTAILISFVGPFIPVFHYLKKLSPRTRLGGF